MRILSIGNSFSQDAQRYLRALAKADGYPMKTVNLYIGGCSLETHYLNMIDNMPAYLFEYNTENTGLKVTIRQALLAESWDVITLQQVSTKSGDFKSYSPFIEELAAYVRKYRPHAKLVLHETWAYENGSERLAATVYPTADDMIAAVKASYEKAAELIGADGIIRAGEAMRKAEEMGAVVHRDHAHASFGVGRYILALSWYRALTGRDITENAFTEFAAPVSDEERKIAIAAVNSVITGAVL